MMRRRMLLASSEVAEIFAIVSSTSIICKPSCFSIPSALHQLNCFATVQPMALEQYVGKRADCAPEPRIAIEMCFYPRNRVIHVPCGVMPPAAQLVAHDVKGHCHIVNGLSRIRNS